MWFPTRPKLRIVPCSLARLGVSVSTSVLVSLVVSPALVAQAQGAPPAIVVTPTTAGGVVAGRGEREKLAAGVMAQTAAALQASQAADQEAFGETVKRLSGAETHDPARALRDYRRFLVGRNPSAALGVQVGLKVAQIRQKIGDFSGALLTCDVLGQKYASEPSSVLLSLQKARVLMGQKKLVQASRCVDEALPDLMALGPGHYAEMSELLRQLAQANLSQGKDGGVERARMIDVDVEQIYLRWLKGGTVSHTWQMFEALKADYEQAGDGKRAGELLPKAADALLQMKASVNNPEGADASVMAARWLMRQGDAQAAQELYVKASAYGNAFVSQVALLDQVSLLVSHGERVAAHKILQNFIPTSTGQPKIVALLTLGDDSYAQGDLKGAEDDARKILSLDVNNNSAQDLLRWSQLWQKKGLLCWPENMTHPVVPSTSKNQIWKTSFTVRSFKVVPLSVLCDDARVKCTVRPMQDDPWFPHDETRFAERIVEVEVPTEAALQTILHITSNQEAGAKCDVSLKISH